MLTQVVSKRYPLWLVRVLRVTLFTVLIAVAAKIAIPVPGTPVPITTQTLMVLLTGMVLGPIEGAISVALYLGAIAVGAPLDALGKGPLVFAGPTAGYLIGFFFAAAISGLGWKAPERYKLPLNILLGFVGVAVIELLGMVGLYFVLQSWMLAFVKGVAPFILVDSGKALLAAALVNLGHQSWLRWLAPRLPSNQQ